MRYVVVAGFDKPLSDTTTSSVYPSESHSLDQYRAFTLEIVVCVRAVRELQTNIFIAI
jgi:hypothetical protein